MKKYAFYFHFNKPASKKAGKPQISIHYKGQCFIVDNIQCSVATKGKIRKRQPYFVMTGKCAYLLVNDSKQALALNRVQNHE